MHNLLRPLWLIIPIVGILTVSAAAQQDPDWRACNTDIDRDPSAIDVKISGCTRILDREGVAGHLRAIAVANRGLAYQNKEDAGNAIADFSEAIRIDPEFPNWRYARAVQYEKRGDFGLAVVDLSEAIRLRPNTAAYLSERGRAYEQTGDLAKALTDFRTALNLDPNESNAAAAIRRLEQNLAAANNNPAAPTQPASQVYRMMIQGHPGAGGKCLDVTGSAPAVGSHLQLSDCQPAAGQIFTYDQNSGLLSVGGLCIGLAEAGDSAAIGLGPCVDRPNRHWRVVANGDYYRFIGSSDRCLDQVNLLRVQDCSLQLTTQLWVLLQAP